MPTNLGCKSYEHSELDDADYTPNPERAIWVRGELDDALADRLRPQILDLTLQSRDPITVFIDSRGGRVPVVHKILSLLRSTEGGESPCRIITVATGKALSAATDLLSGGDVAIANRDTELLYHGHQYWLPKVPADISDLAGGRVTLYNEQRAANFARTCMRRSLFIVSALRSTFDEHRLSIGNPGLSELECFQEVLVQKLSPKAQQVLHKARTMWTLGEGLVSQFLKEIAAGRPSGAAQIEQRMLNACVAFEYQDSDAKGDRLLSAGGLPRINENFYFLREFVGDEHGAEIGDFCDGQLVSEKTEKTRDYFLPFWPFLIAVCRALGHGENELTATDAFWLGLVDTVR